MISTAAGWALPDLTGAILLMEAVEMRLGQIDRLLTMLRKAGHLDNIAGVAVASSRIAARARWTCCAITFIGSASDLGGLPFGHERSPSPCR